ncbi:hypothetical protein Tco_0552595, partial [Tanacetum coccineum]
QRTLLAEQHKPPPSVDHLEMLFSRPSDKIRTASKRATGANDSSNNQYPLPEHNL